MKRLVPVVIVALLAGWAMVRLVVDPVRCNVAVQRALDRTTLAENAGSEYQMLLLVRQNLEELAPWRERCPWSDELHFTIASNLSLLGRYDEAIAAYRDALRYDQRPEYYVGLGLAYLDAGQEDAAVEALTVAARFNAAHARRHVPRLDIQERIRAKLGV